MTRALWLAVFIGCGERAPFFIPVGTGDDHGSDSASPDPGSTTAANVLFILLDDLGLDKVGAYLAHPNPPPTPHIDALAARGIRFNNAYSSPTCSPTRASFLTGRYPTRTGIGYALVPPEETWGHDLVLGEFTIPEALRKSDQGYTSVVLGKWHLASHSRDNPALHPLQQGFDHHWGPVYNPDGSVQEIADDLSYWYWEKNVDGALSMQTSYLTTDTTNDAIHLLRTLEAPWFLYVAYNAPHSPYHSPPPGLLSTEIAEDPTVLEKYDAMVEALDTEIGRLLAAVPEDTTIILAGDNGTPADGIAEPWDSSRSKETVFEGGVHIPLIVAGPLVSEPGTADALVHLVDIFPTVLDLAHIDPTNVVIDGQSLTPYLTDSSRQGRTYLYTESFRPNGPPPYQTHERSLRDADYKYTTSTHSGATSEALYRLDPEAFDEGENLLIGEPEGEDEVAYERLKAEMSRQVADLIFDW